MTVAKFITVLLKMFIDTNLLLVSIKELNNFVLTILQHCIKICLIKLHMMFILPFYTY